MKEHPTLRLQLDNFAFEIHTQFGDVEIVHRNGDRQSISDVDIRKIVKFYNTYFITSGISADGAVHESRSDE